MSSPSTVQLRVFRYKPGDPAPHYDTFAVPVTPRTTVLEALQAIRRDQDPGLMLRHSCHHASCGTCGLRVDGQEVLACVTPLADRGPVVTVEPLQNAPLLGDLVVDMGPFYVVFTQAGMPLVRSTEATAASRPAVGIERLTRFENCLECGLCVSACPVAATDPLYLGPAALAAAWRVVQEPRGQNPARALAWVDQEHGCWRCHLAFECSTVCPNDVQPGQAIAALRQRLVLGEPAPPGPAAAATRPAPAPTGPARRVGLRAWLDPRGRDVGYWAFVLHRLTGLALVAYLLLHLWVLRLLARGPAAWDEFIALARSPLFLALDGLLLFGVLFHGLNGVRVALVGLGAAARRQRGLFWAVLLLTLLLLAAGVAALVAAVH